MGNVKHTVFIKRFSQYLNKNLAKKERQDLINWAEFEIYEYKKFVKTLEK